MCIESMPLCLYGMSCTDLKDGGFLDRKPDCFVCAQFLQKLADGSMGPVLFEFQTKHLNNNHNPAWSDSFTTLPAKLRAAWLRLTVWDHDIISANDFMGRVEIDLAEACRRLPYSARNMPLVHHQQGDKRMTDVVTGHINFTLAGDAHKGVQRDAQARAPVPQAPGALAPEPAPTPAPAQVLVITHPPALEPASKPEQEPAQVLVITHTDISPTGPRVATCTPSTPMLVRAPEAGHQGAANEPASAKAGIKAKALATSTTGPEDTLHKLKPAPLGSEPISEAPLMEDPKPALPMMLEKPFKVVTSELVGAWPGPEAESEPVNTSVMMFHCDKAPACDFMGPWISVEAHELTCVLCCAKESDAEASAATVTAAADKQQPGSMAGFAMSGSAVIEAYDLTLAAESETDTESESETDANSETDEDTKPVDISLAFHCGKAPACDFTGPWIAVEAHELVCTHCCAGKDDAETMTPAAADKQNFSPTVVFAASGSAVEIHQSTLAAEGGNNSEHESESESSDDSESDDDTEHANVNSTIVHCVNAPACDFKDTWDFVEVHERMCPHCRIQADSADVMEATVTPEQYPVAMSVVTIKQHDRGASNTSGGSLHYVCEGAPACNFKGTFLAVEMHERTCKHCRIEAKPAAEITIVPAAPDKQQSATSTSTLASKRHTASTRHSSRDSLHYVCEGAPACAFKGTFLSVEMHERTCKHLFEGTKEDQPDVIAPTFSLSITVSTASTDSGSLHFVCTGAPACDFRGGTLQSVTAHEQTCVHCAKEEAQTKRMARGRRRSPKLYHCEGAPACNFAGLYLDVESHERTCTACIRTAEDTELTAATAAPDQKQSCVFTSVVTAKRHGAGAGFAIGSSLYYVCMGAPACGFKGTYAAVDVHERTCPFVDGNSGSATAGEGDGWEGGAAPAALPPPPPQAPRSTLI